jgi:hypothetical protein
MGKMKKLKCSKNNLYRLKKGMTLEQLYLANKKPDHNETTAPINTTNNLGALEIDETVDRFEEDIESEDGIEANTAIIDDNENEEDEAGSQVEEEEFVNTIRILKKKQRQLSFRSIYLESSHNQRFRKLFS